MHDDDPRLGGRSRPSRSLYPYLKFGFVGLVGVSAGLMTLTRDASLSSVAVATLVGLVVGLVVVYVAFPAVDVESGSGRGRDDDSWR